jgi:hypothetical protein
MLRAAVEISSRVSAGPFGIDQARTVGRIPNPRAAGGHADPSWERAAHESKFTDEFQARLAAHRLWVPESQLHFLAIHDNVDFEQSRFDNRLRAPVASARDRMRIRMSQLVGRAASALAMQMLEHVSRKSLLGFGHRLGRHKSSKDAIFRAAPGGWGQPFGEVMRILVGTARLMKASTRLSFRLVA